MARRLALALAGVLIVALAGAAYYFRPDQAARVATAFIAHTLCSSVFVSGLDADQVYRESLQPTPGIRRISRAFTYTVDRHLKLVTARLLGSFEGTAVFRGETGCIIAHDGEYISPIMDATNDEKIAALLPDIAPPGNAPRNEKLDAAVAKVFDQSARRTDRHTKAVIVLHDGKIVAERYAPGITPDTPLLGFSLSKSIVNALIGILVRQGKLTVDRPAPVGEWKDTSDPRHVISIENLMRMTSGLDLAETNSGFDPSSRILTLEADTAGAAARAGLVALPGMRWVYSSASTMILSRIIKNAVGGQPDNVLQFARRELFAPLGMTNMTLEFDGAGTPLGASSFLGSARDWARFGQLYLNDGIAGGKRILPEGWTAWSAMPTVEADVGYGAGFWTNRGDSRGAQERVQMGMPVDSYFASGHIGQRIVIVPSAKLVIVRLGATHSRGFDIQGTARLVADVVSALDIAP